MLKAGFVAVVVVVVVVGVVAVGVIIAVVVVAEIIVVVVVFFSRPSQIFHQLLSLSDQREKIFWGVFCC